MFLILLRKHKNSDSFAAQLKKHVRFSIHSESIASELMEMFPKYYMRSDSILQQHDIVLSVAKGLNIHLEDSNNSLL